ncbi:iron ABC transporter ATP-binding protein [Nitrincola alkalisediminis]|uniref:iron ABC transporter ATP-binding protein n=1 Tax=Nitrincola alkalisediminis TaxID=1366656 RepID=UPI001874D81D|nr:ATP-binding cassette domain-containing protein [Nitrincola alkalisediminis]
MIEVNGLNKAYQTQKVVDQVSFQLKGAGVTAIIGPNGAGKSTLLGLISRLQHPDQGWVRVDELDVHHCAGDRLAQTLAILRQENQISTRLTVEDLVSFGRYPYSKGRINEQDLYKIEQALVFLDLTDLRHRYLDELSGGQRQRAYIAMVLCQDTRYLLLDEPLNNLDMKHAVGIMKLLRRAADEMGKQVVLVLHDINFAATYADCILAMKEGQLVYMGSPEVVITPEIMLDLYDLEMTIQQVRGKPVAFYYC